MTIDKSSEKQFPVPFSYTAGESTLSKESQQSRVQNAFRGAEVLLDVLKNQTISCVRNDLVLSADNGLENRLFAIYQTAELSIKQYKQKVLDGASEDLNSQKSFKKFKKSIANPEIEMAKIIKKMQIKAVGEIGVCLAQAKAQGKGKLVDEKRLKILKKKMETIAKGGFKAKLMKLSFCRNSYHLLFQQILSKLQDASHQKFTEHFESQKRSSIDQDRVNEFNSAFKNRKLKNAFEKRRLNVTSLTTGEVRAEFLFRKKKIQKQIRSLNVQYLSHIVRTPIIRTVDVNLGKKHVSLESEIIPVNQFYDAYLKKDSDLNLNTFGNIFGSAGISSANRQEPHLVNACLTVAQAGNVYARSFRHAVLSDKYEKNSKVRAKNSMKAAEELVQAAILQEMKERGVKFEDYTKGKHFNLSLSSISLITPDLIRPLIGHVNNERSMLKDQIKALKAIRKRGKIKINGCTIKLNLKLKTYNFGVNVGAVNFKLGLIGQYKVNEKAFKITTTEYKAFIKNKKIDPQAKKEAEQLFKDIKKLMQLPTNYLHAFSQYELPTRLILLDNLMNHHLHSVGEEGIGSAFNCMSGKDRTGMEDVSFKVFVALRALIGKYPTTDELMNNNALQELFADVAQKVKLKSGSLEITEINTGAKGFKLDKEARLWKKSKISKQKQKELEKVFKEAKGLSSTTGH